MGRENTGASSTERCEIPRSRRTGRFRSGRAAEQPKVVITVGKDFAIFEGSTHVILAFTTEAAIKIPGQLFGGNVPDGKQRLESASLELPYPVVANVLKKQVPKCDCSDSSSNRTLPAHGAHPLFVLLVGARPRQFHCP